MPDDPAPVSIPPHAIGGGGAPAAPASRTRDEAARRSPIFKELPQNQAKPSLDALRDVELDVAIELGRVRMRVEDVLKIGEGSVVELNRPAGDPVDVYVSDQLVARGEVVVLNDNFAVRLTEIVSPAKDG
jgi:flagellar motor switch protein FliN/FliY